MAQASDVKHALRAIADPGIATNLSWFFKTGPGEYGEGDRFLGIKVPQIRSVAKQYSELTEPQIRQLARSRFHEDRFCALVILTNRFRSTTDAEKRDQLWAFYLSLVDQGSVNNWDLVDSTALYFGQYLIGRSDAMNIITTLVQHENLWHQRVGVLLTAAFIQAGDLQPTLVVSAELLNHHHDLMHKACGWMLREVGKKDIEALRSFLTKHAHTMPRTMLRYSIEKMPPEERRQWLSFQG